jgi:hypothetical protein
MSTEDYIKKIRKDVSFFHTQKILLKRSFSKIPILPLFVPFVEQ